MITKSKYLFVHLKFFDNLDIIKISSFKKNETNNQKKVKENEIEKNKK